MFQLYVYSTLIEGFPSEGTSASRTRKIERETLKINNMLFGVGRPRWLCFPNHSNFNYISCHFQCPVVEGFPFLTLTVNNEIF